MEDILRNRRFLVVLKLRRRGRLHPGGRSNGREGVVENLPSLSLSADVLFINIKPTAHGPQGVCLNFNLVAEHERQIGQRVHRHVPRTTQELGDVGLGGPHKFCQLGLADVLLFHKFRNQLRGFECESFSLVDSPALRVGDEVLEVIFQLHLLLSPLVCKIRSVLSHDALGPRDFSRVGSITVLSEPVGNHYQISRQEMVPVPKV